MSEFTELVKKFDKIRDYMRDFYIYGFKSREDFKQKSLRTYDNEKRRIQSYLGESVLWDYSKDGKSVYISVDSGKMKSNPLFQAFKAKSFTNNDIMLHFYIIDLLKSNEILGVEKLTDLISQISEIDFDTQTVRNKCKEYVKLGILELVKDKKTHLYKLKIDDFKIEKIEDALNFYQMELPLGVVGSTILDKIEDRENYFRFKHKYIVHTLEDEILITLFKAIKNKQEIIIQNLSVRSKQEITIKVVPIKILVSSQTGRRYLNGYLKNKIINIRLDSIKKVVFFDKKENYDFLKDCSDKILKKCWGVSSGNQKDIEFFSMKLFIDEQNEGYIIERIKKEGRGGVLKKIEENKFIYTIEVFDTNEMLAFVKTFIGRIIRIECSNKVVKDKIYSDINRMYEMYGG